MLWLWRWGLPPPDRGRSRGHRSYLRRVCRLKEEGRQNPFQRKNRKSRAVQSGIILRSIHCSIDFACSAPKMQRDLRGQIWVGWSGKSWGRQAKWNKIIYWCYYRIFWITHGTLSISPPSTRWTAWLTAQRVRHHTGWLVHWPYRNRAERYNPSIRTPHISWHAERGISFYKVRITSNKKIHSLWIKYHSKSALPLWMNKRRALYRHPWAIFVALGSPLLNFILFMGSSSKEHIHGAMSTYVRLVDQTFRPIKKKKEKI